jgi:peptidase M23-like protein
MKTALFVASSVLTALTCVQSTPGQTTCADTSNYFEPLTNGDGQRYPLAIGPVVWYLVGSGIYPVEGSDGRIHLAFVMQFTNTWSVSTTIQSVEVVDPSRNNQLTGTNRVLSIESEDVTDEIRPLGSNSNGDKAGYSKKLAAGQSGVMYFDLTYEKNSDVPCAIALRVHSVQPESKPMPESTLLSPPLKLSSQSPILIAPPFKGDGWVNANGCCLEVGPHRFVLNAMNGTLDPSEGFAIDWIKVNREGKAFRTDGKKSEDWLCYGVDVLAVAPGTVVETTRDLPNEPPGIAPTSLKVSEIAGNHVLLDLGNGRYAMYAHLAPHSVTVHVGDRVKVGDKLGLLGNSGNTTGPHLHFQISDRPSTLDVTSLPFVFKSMMLEGRISLNLEEIDDYSIKGTILPIDKKGRRLSGVMPLSRDVVNFP